jgi:hypothetical protein
LTTTAWDADLHSFEKPHLRIFLSADIVGSTAFKQKSAQSASDGEPPKWFGVVLLFYKLAEQTLSEKWEQLTGEGSSYDGTLCGDRPEIWKTIGDEVLFTKRVTHPGQAFLCLQAWVDTLDVLRKELLESKLDVKSTAWLAEFPLRNQEIVLFRTSAAALKEADQDYARQNYENLRRYYDKAEDAFQDVLVDYIGPSIDSGFRLGGFSSPRKLVISVELAFLLGNEQVRDKTERTYAQGKYVLPDLTFKYDGRFSLKGVLNGDPYPIIWLDLDPDNDFVRAEEAVLNSPMPTALTIKTLAEAYINRHEFLSLPFIDDCIFEEYRAGQEKRRQALLERHRVVEDMKHSSDIEREIPDTVSAVSEDPWDPRLWEAP